MPLFEDAERTEDPTPRKRGQARSEGNVARSQDLNVAILLLAAITVLYFFGYPSVVKISRMMEDILSMMAEAELSPDSFRHLTGVIVLWVVRVVAPFAVVVLVVGILVNYFQVGLLFTTKPLEPKLNKINPANGLKRILSLKGIMKTVLGTFKILVVGTVVVWTLWSEFSRDDRSSALMLVQASWLDTIVYALDLVVTVGFRGVIALILLAIIDLIYQRWQYEQDLKMTKQEVKEEQHRMEGDPKVKERRKKVQQEILGQRMMQEVPKADVVVTNPTHYAVAIRYERETMTAPRCVAKGQGSVARRIREIAMEHSVPVVSKPELARALYTYVEIGGEVPQEFYKAVAEILAYVYKLAGRSRPLAEPVGSVS